MCQSLQPRWGGEFDLELFVAVRKPAEELWDGHLVDACLGTDPRFDGLSISGGARPKSHPLANLLFVIPGETSLQIVLPSGVAGDAEALSQVPDDGPWDVVPCGRKAALPLEVL